MLWLIEFSRNARHQRRAGQSSSVSADFKREAENGNEYKGKKRADAACRVNYPGGDRRMHTQIKVCSYYASRYITFVRCIRCFIAQSSQLVFFWSGQKCGLLDSRRTCARLTWTKPALCFNHRWQVARCIFYVWSQLYIITHVSIYNYYSQSPVKHLERFRERLFIESSPSLYSLPLV